MVRYLLATVQQIYSRVCLLGPILKNFENCSILHEVNQLLQVINPGSSRFVGHPVQKYYAADETAKAILRSTLMNVHVLPNCYLPVRSVGQFMCTLQLHVTTTTPPTVGMQEIRRI